MRCIIIIMYNVHDFVQQQQILSSECQHRRELEEVIIETILNC